MASKEFRVGSVVKFRSNSAVCMTVVKVAPGPDEFTDKISVVWFDKENHLQRAEIPSSALE